METSSDSTCVYTVGPPSGTHRYYFKLYALDEVMALKVGATKAQLEDSMQGHILAQAQLIGRYHRQR